MDFLDLCKKIIQIESTPSTGNGDVAQFCADLCRKAGFRVELQKGDLRGLPQFNLIARPAEGMSEEGCEEIIFQAHLDTVEPGPLGNWTKTDHNPFDAVIDGENIYGLGVADVKLDFLCKLRALTPFVKTKQKRPFVLVGTFGEEIGMHGAHHLMKSKAVNAKFAVIGEPSELQVVYANNGFLGLSFDIPFSEEELKHRKAHGGATSTTQEKIFHGKAAHSSTPHLGDSAILKLIQYLEKMPTGVAIIDAAGGSSVNTVPADAHVELDASASLKHSVGDRLVKIYKGIQRVEAEFLNFDNKNFSPSHPTLNIGLLKTNEKGIHLDVSVRVTPDVPLTQVDAWVDQLKKVCESVQGVCTQERLSPPAFTSLDSELVRGALEVSKQLGLPQKPITKASGTECSVYCQYGLECIVLGPGVSIGNSHTANEYNILPQMERAVDFYTAMVKRFCL